MVCNVSDRRQAVPVEGAPQAALLASAPGSAYADGVVELDGESVVVVELA